MHRPVHARAHLEPDEWQQCIELIEPHFGYFFLRRRVPRKSLIDADENGSAHGPEPACLMIIPDTTAAIAGKPKPTIKGTVTAAGVSKPAAPR